MAWPEPLAPGDGPVILKPWRLTHTASEGSIGRSASDPIPGPIQALGPNASTSLP